MRVKKLSEIKGAKAIDAFAALIPAAFELVEDNEAMELFMPTKSVKRLEKVKALASVVKKHSHAFLDIEAIKRGCDPSDLELSMDDILMDATELMNDDLFLTFFALARKDAITSSCAPETTEGQTG